MPELLPRFSVVVPTHGRPVQLAICLAALAELEYPRDRFEVIVVDDGSPRSPGDVVAAAAVDGLDVRLHVQGRSGPAAARNAGAARASGDFLAFTDDDCAPAVGWLAALGSRLRGDPEAMVGGRTVNALRGNVYATAAQELVSYLYAVHNADRDNATFLTSNNMAVSAELFRELGGFDTRFPRAAAEDRDLCERWLSTARRIVYAPDAVVRHAHGLTLVTFVRQQFGYGRGAYWYHRFRPRAADAGNWGEPHALLFFANLLRAPFASGSPRAPMVAGLLALSQVANLLGFLWERARPARERLSDAGGAR